MSLGCLFGVVSKLGRSEPSLLAFNFAVLRSPPNLSAKHFKVTFGLLPLALLDRVAKLSVGKLEPQAFHGCQVCTRDVLHICEINKVASLGFGARNFNQSVTSELLANDRKAVGRERRQKYSHITKTQSSDCRT